MNVPRTRSLFHFAPYLWVFVFTVLGCETHQVGPRESSLPMTQTALDGDVMGPQGEPLEGARVSVSSHFDLHVSDPAYDVVTDARGHFRFSALPVGRYGLTVTHAQHTALYGGIVEIPRGQASALVLRMGGPGILVKGQVVDEQDKPVANARIEAPALSENEHEVYVTRTDAKGHYVVRLPAMYGYFVVADAPPRPRVHRQLEPNNQVVDLKLDPPPAPRPSDAIIVEWLRKNATPLAGERDMNEAETKAFGAIVGNAPMVALGEATHGSAEFPEWRRRVFQALVRDKGFTVYAVETGFAESFALDAYVTDGRGDLGAAVRALGAWKDETLETMALARWMREYNADPAHREKVHFAGFDPLTANAVPELLAYLKRVDAASVESTEKMLVPLVGITADSTYPALPVQQQEKTRSEVNALVRRMDANRAAYIAQSSEREWIRARQIARVIQQAEVAFRDYAARDEFMFENVQWMAAQAPPGRKFVLDAHNGHIAAGGHSLAYMGRRLRETWGKGYITIGFAFGQGSLIGLDWREKPSSRLDEFSVGAANSGTFDGDLALAGLGTFVIDLRNAPAPIAAWLRSPQSMHDLGGRFYGPAKCFGTYVPSRDFDAIIYVDKVAAIHRLPSQ